MKRVLLCLLLAFACLGLGYCLVKIVWKVFDHIKLHKQSKELRTLFEGLSYTFNLQYKALRPYIGEEMTDKQILASISSEDREMLFHEDSLYIMFPNNAGVLCINTVMARKCLIMDGILLQMMKEALAEINLICCSPICDENDEFFKELQKICEKKGEPAFYDMNEMNVVKQENDKEENDENQNAENTKCIMEYDDIDEDDDYGYDFSGEEYYCNYDDEPNDYEESNDEGDSTKYE